MGMAGTVLQGILIDQAIEVLFQRAGHFGRSTGARAIPQTLGALFGKALYPFAQGRRRKMEGSRDGRGVLARDDFTDGLRTAKDPGFLGLFEHGV
jgi:hypothetical protein